MNSSRCPMLKRYALTIPKHKNYEIPMLYTVMRWTKLIEDVYSSDTFSSQVDPTV